MKKKYAVDAAIDAAVDAMKTWHILEGATAVPEALWVLATTEYARMMIEVEARQRRLAPWDQAAHESQRDYDEWSGRQPSEAERKNQLVPVAWFEWLNSLDPVDRAVFEFDWDAPR